jgi:RHS repeat-associated protein
MAMLGRNFSSEKYRYGFNGKEKDNKDGVIQYDYGFRIYDPRLVRFKSVDPLSGKYPYYTPYQFAGNKPIWCIDLDGLEDIPVNGGSYWSVEKLKQVAMNDDFYKRKSALGETILLNLTYVAIANDDYNKRQTHTSQIVLNQGGVGSNISAVNLSGTYFEDGRVGAWGMPEWTMGYSPNIGTVQPPPPPPPVVQPQNPPNPPINGGNGVNPNVPGNGPVIAPINQQRVRNQNFQRNINFNPGLPTFATPNDAAMVNQVARNAPNQVTVNPPVTTVTNNPATATSAATTTTTTTTTTVQVRSVVTVSLMTTNAANLQFAGTNGRALLIARYRTIRQQLISQGVPAGNIRMGSLQFNVPTAQMGGNVNQTNFNVRTTRTRTTNGTSVTQ